MSLEIICLVCLVLIYFAGAQPNSRPSPSFA